MSLWELNCAVQGWNKAQGAKDDDPPISDDDYYALIAEDMP